MPTHKKGKKKYGFFLIKKEQKLCKSSNGLSIINCKTDIQWNGSVFLSSHASRWTMHDAFAFHEPFSFNSFPLLFLS